MKWLLRLITIIVGCYLIAGVIILGALNYNIFPENLLPYMAVPANAIKWVIEFGYEILVTIARWCANPILV